MTKLTDAQLVVLSAACNRPDRLVLPLPKSLKGGAGIKVVTSLIAKGLIEEAEANVTRGDPVWRKNEEGRAMTLLATVDADALLNSGTEAAPIGPRRATRAKTAKAKAKSRRKPKAPPKAVTVAKRRDGTKQAQLIAMLERAKGATVTEIAEAFGWQAHTVRGAIAGALKKKLGLSVVSEKSEQRGRVYRIAK